MNRLSMRWAWGALIALTALRLAVAGTMPLSADEAYYWTWSRALAPGYLDHPAMVALWIRAGTALAGDGALGVRLLAPLSAALGSVLLALAAADLLGGDPVLRRRRGLVAAALLNATLALGVGSVTMTPDTPLLFFWTLALCAMGRVVATGRGAWWLGVGLAAGLALDSKYTAALTGAGLAGWLVSTRAGRAWLRTPWPWVGGALAALTFMPTLLWNAGHGWASFAKQGGRNGDWHPARAARYLSELLGGQIGLATPLVAVLFGLGLWHLLRARRTGMCRPEGAALVAWVSVLPLAVFVEHALGDRVQANWPGLVYPALAVAAASLPVRFVAWQRGAVALGALLVLPVYLQGAAAPFALPRKLDFTLIRLGGWEGLARDVARVAPPGLPVAADEYGLASELARDLPRSSPVFGVEPRWALFGLPYAMIEKRQLVLVRSLRRKEAPDPSLWRVERVLGDVARARHGVVAERYRLYLVTAGPHPDPAVILPRR